MDARNFANADRSAALNEEFWGELVEYAANDGYDDPELWIEERGAIYAADAYGLDLDRLAECCPALSEQIAREISEYNNEPWWWKAWHI